MPGALLPRFLTWLRGESDSDATTRSLMEEVISWLQGLPEERAELVAAFAGLLARVARADHTLAEVELDRIEVVLAGLDFLPPEAPAKLREIIAAHHEDWDHTAEHYFVRVLKERSGMEERRAVVRALFEVAAADGNIDEHEEQELFVIGRGLMLYREDLAAIRAEFREHRAIVRKDGPTDDGAK